MAIQISGILKDGLGKPISCTIELRCKKTSLTVITKTEAQLGLDISGVYNMRVEPGEYSVSLYVEGYPPKAVGDILVYSDSIPGTLNDFLMMPGESDLTPELVQIFQQLRSEAQQAAGTATGAATVATTAASTATEKAETATTAADTATTAAETATEKAETATTAASTATAAATTATDKADMATSAAETATTAAETSTTKAETATTAADTATTKAETATTAADTATTKAGIATDAADTATTKAGVATTAADTATAAATTATTKAGVATGAADTATSAAAAATEKAGVATAAASSVKSLTAEASTLPPGSTATAEWDAEENKLKLGIPTGEEGPPAQLSVLLQSISALPSAANKFPYFNGPDSATLANLSAVGRVLVGQESKSKVLEYLNLSEAATKTDGAVPIGQGGTGATTAEDARENLGLVIGAEAGNVVVSEGMPVTVNVRSTGTSWQNASVGGLRSAVTSSGEAFCPFTTQMTTMPGNWTLFGSIGMYTPASKDPNEAGIAFSVTDSGTFTKPWVFNNRGGVYGPNSTWLWGSVNTAVDANGFIKRASPVVKLFGDGGSEPNSAAEGVTSERISEGVYRLSGAIMGLCADTAWHIEVPADENKQPLIWVDYEIEPAGDVIVKTYHRTHQNAPAFARNERDGYADGEPVDIPAGRWVDLRVQVYKDAE